MLDDRHLRHALRQPQTLHTSRRHLDEAGRNAARLRLVTEPTPFAAFSAPPPRRMSDSELRRAVEAFTGHGPAEPSTAPRIPRTGPARIAARTRRERQITRALAWATGALGLVLVAWLVVSRIGGAA